MEQMSRRQFTGAALGSAATGVLANAATARAAAAKETTHTRAEVPP